MGDELPDVTLVDDDTTGYNITVGEQTVGVLATDGSGGLIDLRIDPTHQENGYGTAAVRTWMEQSRCTTFHTRTIVVHPAMERLLRSLGWEPMTDDPRRFEWR